MTKNLITAPAGTNLETAKEILHQNKIEKLPLINDKGILQGLITARDIIKKDEFPNSSKDSKGRLLVGAAIGVKDDVIERTSGLLSAGADCIVIDIAHGHSESVISTIKLLRKEFGNVEIIAGNVATREATEDLISAGADCCKAGVGGGAVCITRIVTGSGVPQLHAVLECCAVGAEMDVPIMADGGIRTSGDIVKAIGAGANSVMLGSLLAGTEESPGTVVMREGKKYKIYRGSAGYGTALSRKQQKLGGLNITEYTPEGVESLVPYKGHVHEVINPLLGGLRSGMSYSGARTIEELKQKVKFLKITGAGMKESTYHDVKLL
jgi:IMP dehydrogenase